MVVQDSCSVGSSRMPYEIKKIIKIVLIALGLCVATEKRYITNY